VDVFDTNFEPNTLILLTNFCLYFGTDEILIKRKLKVV